MQGFLFNMLDGGARNEAVAILVGPNGAGKSNLLRKIALEFRYHREVAIICNTAYDRFSGLRGVERISAGRGGQSPKTIIKRAVGLALGEDSSRFFQIRAILEYCHYEPVFGFRIRAGRHPLPDRHTLNLFDELDDPTDSYAAATPPLDREDLERAIDFLDRHPFRETIWVSPGEGTLGEARSLDLASVLRNEKALRRSGLLRDIEVFLARGREIIQLHHASSGELSLISSLVFLIAVTGKEPLIIVDEPENSLHPGWQREYVDKLLAALAYRAATVVVATHAPLVVTGAIAQNPDQVSVYQVREGEAERLPIDGKREMTSGIEEILWRAFDMVTPASHFVSEEIVQTISRFDAGEIDKQVVLNLISDMEDSSFDSRQRGFFKDVRELVDRIESQKSTDDGADA